MGFGINKKYIAFLLNPQLLYNYYQRNKLLKRFKDKNLSLGLFVSINNSKFGKYIHLNDGVKLYNSELGDHTYVNSNTIIKHSKIGKFCSIGSNVQFGMGIHPTNLISTHPAFYSNNKPFKTFSEKNHFEEYKTISVGNDVWIGSDAIIMGGISIGNGAIVGTRAVVTKDIKPYEIVGGVPAKHIKFRISEDLIDIINASKWWEKNEEWFEENYELFLEQENFLNFINNSK